MALRPGPGAKALMVVFGIAVMVLGLWAYGYLPVLDGLLARDPPAGDVAGDPVAVGPGEDGSPGAGGPLASGPATDGSAASAEASPSGEPPSTEVGGQSAPPLLGTAPQALRPWRGEGSAAALAALGRGEVDLAIVPLHEVLAARGGPGVLVIGVLPAEGDPMLCAGAGTAADPLSRLEAGVRVLAAPAERLAVAHLAAVRGIAPEALVWAAEGSAADLRVTERLTEGDTCVGLASLGLVAPRLVLAPEREVRTWGASYRRAVRELGAADAAARRFLLAGPDQPRSYARRSAWLAGVAARLEDAAVVEPPTVADWIVREETP